MNIYDFDKTIYRNDSSLDFYVFNLRKDLSILKYVPMQLLALLRYQFKLIDKTQMKQIFYQYFRSIDDMDARVREFWTQHQKRLMPYYLNQKESSDVIISASPEFMLKPICDDLGVTLIASVVDAKTGHSEENCYGQAKVTRFKQQYPQASVDAFYSDSLSDTPMAKLATQAYLVKGDQIVDWPF